MENDNYDSSLNPEIAEFNPLSCNQSELSIQEQWFNELQWINTQMQQVKYQTDNILTPMLMQLNQQMAPLQTNPTLLQLPHNKMQFFTMQRNKIQITSQINQNQVTYQQLQQSLEYTQKMYQEHKNKQYIVPELIANIGMVKDDDYKTPEFKAFVGIDFGTEGSGLAYAFRNKDGSYSSYIHNMWNKSGATRKPKTTVLFDNYDNKISVGNNAKKMFFSNQGQQRWKLFEKFKMSLYNEPVHRSELKQAEEKFDFVDELKEEIGSSNDNKLKRKSESVFIIYLMFLKDNAFKFIDKNLKKKLKLKGNVATGFPQVQYYLTVPAIWSDKAKDKMVQWAIVAGLVDNRRQIQIVYEPDCASLSIQHAIIRNQQPTEGSKKKSKGLKSLQPQIDVKVPLKKGDKYILLDVGGGTCDVVCHEMMGHFCIAEVLHPSGGKWGSCEIDNKFIELLGKLFSQVLLNIYQMDDQQESYLKFLNNFANEKEKYFNIKHKDKDLAEYHCIKMPTNFVNFLINQFNDEFANHSDRFNYQRALQDLNTRIQNQIQTLNIPKCRIRCAKDGDIGTIDKYMIKIVDIGSNNTICESDVEEDSDSDSDQFQKDEINYVLSMNNDVWQYLFDHITDPIIAHCQKILTKAQMKDCRYIFLVGGFANSKYFQERIKAEFKRFEDLTVVTPDLPGLCVVDGASRYGFNNQFVKIRKLPKTCGIAVWRPKSDFKNFKAFPRGHISKYTRFSDIRQTEFIEQCFDVFVRRGETIKLNDKPIIHEVSKMYESQTDALIEIYCSDYTNPVTTTSVEATKLGQVKVDLAKDIEDITVEFYFSSTLLTVYSYPKGQPKQKKRCRVEYL